MYCVIYTLILINVIVYSAHLFNETCALDNNINVCTVWHVLVLYGTFVVCGTLL